MRGNASCDAPRHALGRRASRTAFPRGAWERSSAHLPSFTRVQPRVMIRWVAIG
ncbi:DUF1534 domain-containing protein [Pseudomonas fluorescens]|nr:DUF1534 domain-containing protein [Pseudomonas fluorescens]